jgi:predicted transcriptional regulator
MYGTMYGVKRTTVYLPDELKTALEQTARVTGRSEAELIREGIRRVTDERRAPEPRALFSSGIADLAENVDRHLEGFGER